MNWSGTLPPSHRRQAIRCLFIKFHALLMVAFDGAGDDAVLDSQRQRRLDDPVATQRQLHQLAIRRRHKPGMVRPQKILLLRHLNGRDLRCRKNLCRVPISA